MNPTKLLLLTMVTVAGVLSGCSDPQSDSKVAKIEKVANESSPRVIAESVSSIKASTSLKDLGPEGLFSSQAPGWHAASPVRFPQEITVEFSSEHPLHYFGLLQQKGQPARAPKAYRLDASRDGKNWASIGGSDNACTPNLPDGWNNIEIKPSTIARYLRITIFSNCGDEKFLTLQGIRAG